MWIIRIGQTIFILQIKSVDRMSIQKCILAGTPSIILFHFKSDRIYNDQFDFVCFLFYLIFF